MLDNIQNYFIEQYQFSLKEVSYNRLEIEPVNATLSISDEINTDIKNNVLLITLTRTIFFEPESAFNLKVTFDAVLGIKEEMIETVNKIDWKKEFVEINNPYMVNIMTRVSALIANITSSYGQPPVVTPPGLVIK